MHGSTVDTCAITVLGGFWTILQFFLHAGVDSDPVVDSRPALRGDFDVFTALRSVRGRCFDCMHGPSSLHLQSGRYVYEPLASDRHLIAVAGLLEKNFPVFHTGWEVSRSLEVLPPR